MHRPLDGPALQPLNGISDWIQGMSISDKLWLVGKLETQGLYGQSVTVLEEQGDWVYVALHDQPTVKHSSGYPGWLHRQQLTAAAGQEIQQLQDCRSVVVNQPTAWLWDDTGLADPFMQISFNTRLMAIPNNDAASDVLQVQTLCHGTKYIRVTDLNLQAAHYLDGSTLVEKAKQFIGLPYLWSGVSGFGYDCSGFMHALYNHYGIMIPRDASEQAKVGITVLEQRDLQSGDLLFFAYEGGRGRIHHVGMYAGEGMMIHSPNTGRSIEIIPLDTTRYAEEYAGARRFIMVQ
jgi:hypothetical protein